MSGNKVAKLEDIKKLIKNFLEADGSQVLAITGGWGIGKTYTWNKVFDGLKKHLKEDYWSYVSLFGIESLESLKRNIFDQMQSKSNFDESPFICSLTYFKKALIPLGKTASKAVSKISQTANIIPGGSVVSSLIEDCSDSALLYLDKKYYTFIKNWLICIDDLERKDEKLNLLDIFGIISQLKEEKNCKIVLIFNKSEFNEQDKEIFNQYKEKVIDKHLYLNLDPKECFELIFTKTEGELTKEAKKPKEAEKVIKVIKVINVIKQSSLHLEIKNMRTLKKIKDRLNDNSGLLHILEEYEKKFKGDVRNNNEDKGKSIFNDKDLPLYEKVRNRVVCNYVAFQKMFLERDKNKEDLKLEDYQCIKIDENGIDYSLTNVLKKLIVEYIENGYLLNNKKEEFHDALKEFSNEIEKNIFKMDYNSLYDYFNNLKNIEINFIKLFKNFYFKYFELMHVQEIDHLLHYVMNISDKNLICDDYSNIIRHFDENIMNNSLPYDVKYDRNGFKGQKYEFYCQEFERVVENKIIKKEDKSLFKILMDYTILQNKDIEKISNASENSIYIELKSNLGDLPDFVYTQFIIFDKFYNTKYLEIFEKIIFSVEKLLKEYSDFKFRLGNHLIAATLSNNTIPKAFDRYQSLENKKIDLSETFINDVISRAIEIRNKKGYSVHGQVKAVELVKDGEFTVPTN